LSFTVKVAVVEAMRVVPKYLSRGREGLHDLLIRGRLIESSSSTTQTHQVTIQAR
jgi:hypothetical protein